MIRAAQDGVAFVNVAVDQFRAISCTDSHSGVGQVRIGNEEVSNLKGQSTERRDIKWTTKKMVKVYIPSLS